MALQAAPLGQLPYMQLGHQQTNYVEPAWHKALASLLVGAAGTAGKDLVTNAMSSDYSQQAGAMGLPGATEDPGKQGFLDQLLHGPRLDKTGFQEGVRLKVDEDRSIRSDNRLAQQLGISQAQLDEAKREHDQSAGLRKREIDSLDASRKQAGEQHAWDTASRTQDRWETLLEKRREAEMREQERKDRAPAIAAETKLREAQAAHETLMNDPAFAARVAMEKERAMVGPEVYDQLQQIRGNINRQLLQSQQPKTAPNQVPNPVAPAYDDRYNKPLVPTTSPADALNAREAANRAPAASTSTQAGQTAPMQAAPQVPERQESSYPNPITINPMEQHTGDTDFSSILSLVRDPQAAHDGTQPGAVVPSSFAPPFQFDPEVMRQAVELARRLGQPQGVGATPGPNMLP